MSGLQTQESRVCEDTQAEAQKLGAFLLHASLSSAAHSQMCRDRVPAHRSASSTGAKRASAARATYARVASSTLGRGP